MGVGLAANTGGHGAVSSTPGGRRERKKSPFARQRRIIAKTDLDVAGQPFIAFAWGAERLLERVFLRVGSVLPSRTASEKRSSVRFEGPGIAGCV